MRKLTFIKLLFLTSITFPIFPMEIPKKIEIKTTPRNGKLINNINQIITSKDNVFLISEVYGLKCIEEELYLLHYLYRSTCNVPCFKYNSETGKLINLEKTFQDLSEQEINWSKWIYNPRYTDFSDVESGRTSYPSIKPAFIFGTNDIHIFDKERQTTTDYPKLQVKDRHTRKKLRFFKKIMSWEKR